MTKQDKNGELNKLSTFKPKTEGQENYLRSMSENTITFCYGPSGTAKSCCAIVYACTQLEDGRFDKIILTRPMVETASKSMGALPGSWSEKFSPFLLPVFAEFKKWIGDKLFRDYLGKKIIEILPLELCRGYTFENAIVIVDEAQNATYEQLKMIVTRIGPNTKMIINGDVKQTDLKNKTGVNDFWEMVGRLNFANISIKHKKEKYSINTVELTSADIVRHPLINAFLQAVE